MKDTIRTLHPEKKQGVKISREKYEVIRKKAGKIVLRSTNELSNDGKTMTITTKGVNANGQAVHNVRVYDKR